MTATLVMALGLVVLAAFFFGFPSLFQRNDLMGLARVVDGDSLVIGGEQVRLRGIDAPEMNQTCRRGGQDVACGREARSHLTDLIGAREVTCERRGQDRYGRTLAVCRVDGDDIGGLMVSSGHAVAFGGYITQEMTARALGRGLWAGEFVRPRDWRAAERERRAGS